MDIIVDVDYRFTPKQKSTWEVLAEKEKTHYMLYGSSRSGKTFLVCYFIRQRARIYSGSKHIICRFSFANAIKTVWLQTLYPLLKADERLGICKINEQKALAQYVNGSTIALGGLEPSRIDSVLAAEYGTIFVTEANENKFQHIEMLFSRLNDTAANDAGVKIVPKFICDLNPTTHTNWTHALFIRGQDPTTGEPKPGIEKYQTIHFKAEDNEKYLSPGYIDSLKNLSPGMRKRFYEGEFGTFEGLVYSLDEGVHFVDDFAIPEDWERGASIDFGFVAAFGTLWGALDKSNECLYIYREYKKERTTVRVHAENLLALTKSEKISFWVSDHDASDRATLQENGIITNPANKDVLSGLDKMIDLFIETEQKKANIKIFRSCVHLTSELYAYRWKDSTMKNSAQKDRDVVKEDDHLCLAGSMLIVTTVGLIPLREIRKGDMVYTRMGYKRVSDARCTGIVLTYTYPIGDVEIVGTPTHKVYVEGGEKSMLKNLTSRDRVMSLGDGLVGGCRGGIPAGYQPVYNLTVEDAHEYYANGILVANCDCLRYLGMRFFPDRREPGFIFTNAERERLRTKGKL